MSKHGLKVETRYGEKHLTLCNYFDHHSRSAGFLNSSGYNVERVGNFLSKIHGVLAGSEVGVVESSSISLSFWVLGCIHLNIEQWTRETLGKKWYTPIL